MYRLSRAWLAVLFGICLIVSLAEAQTSAPVKGESHPVVFRTQTMGTWASLTLVTSDSASVANLAYEALLVLHHVDSLMSNWTEISEVARINRDAGLGETVVHPEVATVLTYALQVGQESRGAFDITIEPLVRLWGFLRGPPRVPQQEEIVATLELVGPDKIHFDAESGTITFTRDGIKVDLGGIAKGYGVDRVADLLRNDHATNTPDTFVALNALIDLSGNMVALGNAPGREGWAVGIRDPSGEHSYLARIHLYNEAVATSGNYEQFVSSEGQCFGHILDPRTGWPAQGLGSVTVVAAQAMVADAWATALFVLGPEAARQAAHDREDLAAVLVEPVNVDADEPENLVFWVEEQLRDRFEIKNELTDQAVVHYF